MSIGIFTDKSHVPCEEEVLEVLSSAESSWKNLIKFIESNYSISGDFKFYGKNFGWALRYRKSGRVLISMYPGKDEFTVQIILNLKEVYETLKLNIDPKIKKYIEEKPAIREGKWIYIKISPDTDLNDIKEIIEVRSPIK